MVKIIHYAFPALLLLSGCAGLGGDTRLHFPPGSIESSCAQFIAETEQAITKAGVRDTQAVRISGFPYLRVNRFLASFTATVLDDPAFAAWLDQLQALAIEGWDVEINNLHPLPRENLQASIPLEPSVNVRSLHDAVRHCSGVLRNADLANPARRELLSAVAQVPPEYQTWQRVLGLYPVTALAFTTGIQRWQNATRRVFSQAIEELPVQGRLMRFSPPAAGTLTRAQVAAILKIAARNPLRIPEPGASDRARLLAAFAPVFEIDVATTDDRIGRPHWFADTPSIDTGDPTVYTYISHTRYAGENLLQLNYTIWFPARPRTGLLDLLGGHIDGITWRVTLMPDGRPWLYDSMHNCGCYHLFFPTKHARLREQPPSLEEQSFVPQTAPDTTPLAGLTLRIAQGTHYLQRVLDKPAHLDTQTVRYRLENYDVLRSLPVSIDTRRNLFREDGIVPGTDRLERYLFWPMGIPHPGAMRQRGHHATAFVGRRHFDDPYLLEKNFELLH